MLFERTNHRAHESHEGDPTITVERLQRIDGETAHAIRKLKNVFDQRGNAHNNVVEPELSGIENRYMPEGHSFFVAKKGDTIIGFVSASRAPGTFEGHIGRMRVANAYRHSDVERLLIHGALEHLRNNLHCSSVSASVDETSEDGVHALKHEHFHTRGKDGRRVTYGRALG